MLRIIVKVVKRAMMAIGIFLLSYMFLAVVLSLLSTIPKKTIGEKQHEIFITTNGVHLDIVLPKSELGERFLSALNLSRSTQYVAFGWGDKGFYLNTPNWSDLTFSTAVKALFLKSETAIHLTSYKSKRAKWHSIDINEEQLTLLLAYIDQSFKKDSDRQFMEIANAGYTNADTFYEANGSYNLIVTCNTWVNRALKAAYIKTSIWSPFDKGVLWQVRRRKSQI